MPVVIHADAHIPNGRWNGNDYAFYLSLKALTAQASFVKATVDWLDGTNVRVLLKGDGPEKTYSGLLGLPVGTSEPGVRHAMVTLVPSDSNEDLTGDPVTLDFEFTVPPSPDNR